ncbi:DUF3844 domain-containing protein [Mycena kentingensis (nom. inval.)]|nr:DUF3844 domain-containing protein [Mycena kentingensis (nom. inval.)]
MMWTPTQLTALAVLALPAVRAVDIYLSPPPAIPHTPLDFAAEDATAVLSHHLGLESFDVLKQGNPVLDELFQGQGAMGFVGQDKEQSVLLLTMDAADADKLRLPDALTHVATLESPPTESLDTVVSSYLHRAAHVYTSVFSPLGSFDASESLQSFYSTQISSISSFLSSTEAAFAAQELSALRTLRSTLGPESPEYAAALQDTRSLLQTAVARGVKVALLTFSASAAAPVKRQVPSQAPFPSPRPAPQQPIGSIGTCHTSLDACNNSTSSCSGRGECMSATKAGRTCFVCACGKTTSTVGTKVRSETWVGEKCERKDVSGPFILLTGTTVVLILVIAMSVGLLYSVGDIELPSVLMGGAVHPKKD